MPPVILTEFQIKDLRKCFSSFNSIFYRTLCELVLFCFNVSDF